MNTEPRLLRIFEGWIDGGIPDDEQAELLRQLDSDPGFRREFAEQLVMIGTLKAASETEPRWLELFAETEEIGDSADGSYDFVAATMARIEPSSHSPVRRGFLLFAPLALAAAVALGFIVNLLIPVTEENPTAVVKHTEKPTPVAIVTASGGQTRFPDGMFLASGDIEQDEGWLAIQTLTGVSMTLTAPFKTDLISPRRVHIGQGQVRIHVPEGAEGFVMESPGFEVFDHGAEYASTVNPDGTGNCKVFKGRVDVSFVNSLGSLSVTRRLNAIEEVEISPAHRTMKKFPLGGGNTYAEMKTPSKPALSIADSYPEDVLALGPSDYWRFEDMADKKIVNEIPGRPAIVAFGDVAIETETSFNHSGRLKYSENNGAFVAEVTKPRNLTGDFTVAMFTQFDWLQNYTLFASSRWDDENPRVARGNQFVFKAYASFEQSGIKGTGLYAVFRDKPAWHGGIEIFGDQLMRPNFWHHVAITRNSSEVLLYLDGKLVARQDVDSVPVNFDHLYIGRSDSPTRPPEYLERGLIGNVDEVAIFDRQLTEEEINLLVAGKL